MLRAFFTSATGMRAQELLIDNTANNLANVNTNGFKRSKLDFADLLYTTQRPAGTEIEAGQNAPIGLQIGSGVRPIGTTKVFTAGMMKETLNPTDVAIEGDGFFKVTTPNGDDRFTRDGAFQIDASGNLVTGDGYPVEGVGSIPPEISASMIAIGVDGTVSARVGYSVENLGQIQLYRFQNPAGLSSEGGNLYSETAASGSANGAIPGQDGTGTLRQYFLENSNVEVVTELVSLITAQRAYEINSRAIRAGDEMLANTSQIVR